MKTKKQGRNYIIQDYEGLDSLKLNRKKTDETLAILEKSCGILAKTITDLHNDDTELYWFIHDHISLPDSYYICSDRLYETMSAMHHSIKDLQKFLKEHDDEILPPEHYITLEDLGFKDMFFYHKPKETHIFERTKIDYGEREVTEEVVIADGEIIRRQRTTLWEITPGCKSSKSIKYKKLRMTKQLKDAAENTIMILNKKKGTNDDD
jgi:hypothetical protein